MNRFLKNQTDIDSYTVLSFFENRAVNTDKSDLTKINFASSDVAYKRDLHERNIITDKIIDYSTKVVDLGCGTGRWCEPLCNDIKKEYIGIDFSPSLINIAKKNHSNVKGKAKFYTTKAQDIGNIIKNNDVTLALVSAMFLYLNDKEIAIVLKSLNTILTNNSCIYMREPVSLLKERLTLKDFYSEEIQSYYNAIYRTDEEYKEYFVQYLPHFDISEADFIYPKELHNQNETRHKYYILKK